MIGEIHHVLMSADDVTFGFESGAQPYLGSVRDDLYPCDRIQSKNHPPPFPADHFHPDTGTYLIAFRLAPFQSQLSGNPAYAVPGDAQFPGNLGKRAFLEMAADVFSPVQPLALHHFHQSQLPGFLLDSCFTHL